MLSGLSGWFSASPFDWQLAILFSFMGASVGSFLNVVWYRYPVIRKYRIQGRRPPFSLSYPASHCPVCKRPIHPLGNIPVLSYLFLRGKCRNCQMRIPLRYFLLELAGGFVGLFLYLMR